MISSTPGVLPDGNGKARFAGDSSTIGTHGNAATAARERLNAQMLLTRVFIADRDVAGISRVNAMRRAGATARQRRGYARYRHGKPR